MVSKASEDLPEPERPVMTTRRSRGISRLMFLRLCSRAPRIINLSAIYLCSSSPRRFPRFRDPPRILNRRDHTRRTRDAAARDIERRAMVRRGPHEGQPNRNIHRAIKLQCLERDQALIMIHSHSRVEAEASALLDKGGVGRKRPERVDAAFARTRDRRRDDAALLVAE